MFCTQPSERRHNQSHTLKIIIAGMSKVGGRQQLGGANVAISLSTQMSPSMEKKQTHRHRKQTCGCQGGGGEGKKWSWS